MVHVESESPSPEVVAIASFVIPLGHRLRIRVLAHSFGVNRGVDDIETATFTTRDPAFSATDTAYTYAGDDPINAAYPTGDVAQPCSLLADPQANWRTNQVNRYLLKGCEILLAMDITSEL